VVWSVGSGHAAADCDSPGSTLAGDYSGSGLPPDCSAVVVPPVSLAGPDNESHDITRPGSYQYSAAGGLGPYQWSVAGTEGQGGLSIDPTGTLTLSSQTCGSFVVTVQDRCGTAVSRTLRVESPDAGRWVRTGECGAFVPWDEYGDQYPVRTIIRSNRRYTQYPAGATDKPCSGGSVNLTYCRPPHLGCEPETDPATGQPVYLEPWPPYSWCPYYGACVYTYGKTTDEWRCP
jgi:hypothetical protein